MRYRVHFSKTEEMRYTSHLDLQRTWERTIRRASLPLSYSQGFNPRPKLNLGFALPLGITSECELLDIWLDHECTAKEVAQALVDSAPPGIKINDVSLIDLKSPKLPTLIDSACYQVTLLEETPNLGKRINELMISETLIRERRGKTYDLRPLLNSIEILSENRGGQGRLKICLRSRPGETGRPDEVLLALHINHFSTLIHRTEIILTTP